MQKMHREDIFLPDINTVKEFVAFANGYDFPITLYSDKYIINGKSIMGIFGLDLSQPLEIEVSDSYPEDFKEKLKNFKFVSQN